VGAHWAGAERELAGEPGADGVKVDSPSMLYASTPVDGGPPPGGAGFRTIEEEEKASAMS
jgi:hypothetical protein